MSWKVRSGLGILVTASAVALYWFWPFRQPANELRLPGVVEIQEVLLGSKVGGRVAEVAAKESDLVQPGQLLVRFDVPELEAQLAQQRAKVRAAEAEFEKAKAGAREEEKRAARATLQASEARLAKLVAGWREEEKEQARSELKAAQADLEQARKEFTREERLLGQVAGSLTGYDTARANRDRSQGRVNAAQAKLDMLLRGTRPEEIEEAKAEVARLKANLDLLETGNRSEDIDLAEARVVEARSKLREIEANVQESFVRAPETAVVDVLSVRKGALVPPNQPIVRVLRADDIWVKVYVAETDLARLRLGQAVQVTIDSYPDRRFEGSVLHIDAESEFTPRNVQSIDERRHQVFGVRIRVPQPADPSQRVFKSGMAAEVIVPLAD
jgi:HlyD family secretion protein